MQQHDSSWGQLMLAAERIAEHCLTGGETADAAVDHRVAELISDCPGFEEHEYRQAFWQGLQNLRQRFTTGEASLPA